MMTNYDTCFVSNNPFWNGSAILEIGNTRLPVRINKIDQEAESYFCSYGRPEITITCTMVGTRIGSDLKGSLIYGLKSPIQKVIYHDPATIVYWTDGTKTVVKCNDGDIYSPELGLLMAIAKKFLGDNTGRYNNELRKWLSET